MEPIRITEVHEYTRHARNLFETLPQKEGATVLALHGELGAGKTTFVQSLGKALGVSEHITSPTFLVMRRYQTTHDYFHTLVHIDAYRVEDIEEMRVLHIPELLRESGVLVAIEWAERVTELVPPEATHLSFAHAGEGVRILTIEYYADKKEDNR